MSRNNEGMGQPHLPDSSDRQPHNSSRRQDNLQAYHAQRIREIEARLISAASQLGWTPQNFERDGTTPQKYLLDRNQRGDAGSSRFPGNYDDTSQVSNPFLEEGVPRTDALQMMESHSIFKSFKEMRQLTDPMSILEACRTELKWINTYY